ncbi:unnamed protein product, partial [Mycena citricolor]
HDELSTLTAETHPLTTKVKPTETPASWCSDASCPNRRMFSRALIIHTDCAHDSRLQ